MKTTRHSFLLVLVLVMALAVFSCVVIACSDGQCKLLDQCSTDGDCEAGLYCFGCPSEFSGSRCVRSTTTNQFQLLVPGFNWSQTWNVTSSFATQTWYFFSSSIANLKCDLSKICLFVVLQNNSLPFNKYAFLTTHNAFAIEGEPSHTGVPRVTFTNQEDIVTQQLNNGVRALMLDTYDFQGDVWLCHSFKGKCHDYTAFEPAIDTLNEIQAFLSANPGEIVTLILEDYVEAPNGLTNVFKAAGLMKYWFPISNMPKSGQDWPLVSDMVTKNQRLLVFTSKQEKEQSEGIAYQWNYMVENQYGNDGMKAGSCSNRAESSPLNDKTKSLVLVNYFGSVPIKQLSCQFNSEDLVSMLNTCYGAAGNRWSNFVAVDFYKRSGGGGSFQATDTLNGELICGCNDVHACVVSYEI
ncbi:putative PLC-like phosphodiesterase, TIM beta/alpha-barrel domain-containing protein [Rosa chinensis]|uniref:Putative PLC-like phosphodiesterase, TIM beta/alpha-barrel domain-containing protein n=1 Tax=Rosa chinensis TaxID=74649 RepID=A0A2P6S8S1_ROSCH|nr:putative PLC-like phosphodiesterase, TIM beta/alpha-barrel domain-containing protein [Rosa chinensis]